MFGFLDTLPLNGIKTGLGILGSVLTLGAMAADFLDVQTGLIVLGVIQTWTGVALAHKADKLKRGV